MKTSNDGRANHGQPYFTDANPPPVAGRAAPPAPSSDIPDDRAPLCRFNVRTSAVDVDVPGWALAIRAAGTTNGAEDLVLRLVNEALAAGARAHAAGTREHNDRVFAAGAASVRRSVVARKCTAVVDGDHGPRRLGRAVV
jgi:hypothetical protein